MRLLFVGIDGLDSARVLSDGGVFADWDGVRGHCVPEIAATGPSWTTIYTGLKAQAHGVTDTWGLRAKGKQLPWIWDALNERGLSCGVIGLPVTWPAQEIDDWWVAGLPVEHMGADGATWPTDLSVPDYIPDYINVQCPHGPEIGQWRYIDNAQNAWRAMHDVAWSHVQAAAQLYSAHPVDCLLIGFAFPDRYGHTIIAGGFSDLGDGWRYVDALARRIVDALMAAFEPTQTVVVSDHGFDRHGHTDHGIYLATGNRQDIEIHNWDVKRKVLEAIR